MLILIAEDERITRRKLQRQLQQMGHEVIESADGAEAWDLFQQRAPAMVVCDWEMPHMNGVDLVRHIRAADSRHYVYIVMLTGKSEKEDVVQGIEAGADDFVTKPFDRGELRARVNAGLRIVKLEQKLASANDRLRHELAVARELSDAEHRKHEELLLGNSIPVRALREGIQQNGQLDEPLELLGPSGAGREAVARAIHRSSARRDRPFIYVACAHIADGNETVFGFHPHAQDGGGSQDVGGSQDEDRISKALLADRGTLYLECVEALSEKAQQQLFAFLTDAATMRAAGTAPQPDVRVIVSVSEKSESESSAAGLSNELKSLFTQNRICVPSLAERRQDIGVIADFIVDRCARSAGKSLDGLSAESIEMLKQYSWPGNIRELRSVLERAVVLAAGTELDIPEELLREGRRVGGYRLQQRLGEGGMGEVWLAKHALLARPSAVKLIRQSVLRGDAKKRELLVERFQREANATAQLRSPNTVELYDFGVTDEGDFYYVMEYLHGVDLNSLVQEFGPLPASRVIHFLKQACESLGEAHRNGLVHRDVKPENLFACTLGRQYDFLKVLDFGVVRNEASEDQTSTSAGTLTGSPACMSPEAAMGEQVEFASDVYGLGCVGYWLLTGQHVFAAPNVMQLLLQHVSRAPQAPSELVDHVPVELEKLVLSCLAKKASERPQDAVELGEQLASLPVPQPWDNSQAQQWWSAHVPAGVISVAMSDTSVESTAETHSSLDQQSAANQRLRQTITLAGPLDESADFVTDGESTQGESTQGESTQGESTQGEGGPSGIDREREKDDDR